jgi:hypothetical protein
MHDMAQHCKKVTFAIIVVFADEIGPGMDSKGNMRDHTQAGKGLSRSLTSHACTNWQGADALDKWFSELNQPALPSASKVACLPAFLHNVSLYILLCHVKVQYKNDG